MITFLRMCPPNGSASPKRWDGISRQRDNKPRPLRFYLKQMMPIPLQSCQPFVGFALSFEAEYCQASILGLNK
jgi:hypothetical protein